MDRNGALGDAGPELSNSNSGCHERSETCAERTYKHEVPAFNETCPNPPSLASGRDGLVDVILSGSV